MKRNARVAQHLRLKDTLARIIIRRFLKRASNSLLILLSYPFMALLHVLVSPAPAGGRAAMRHTPHRYITRLRESAICRAIFQASGSLRSFTPTWLGEERVRSLVHGLLMSCLLAACAASASAETPADAAEKISGIIRAEIMAMPEWNDADVRVEITGEIKGAPDESFRLAPNGLKLGRRNVFATIDVIRDGKTARSLSIPAVVHISATAMTASRKIASGEILTEEDMRESEIETTDVSAALVRDPKDIAGKTARRVFAAGAPFTMDAFSEPLLVSRGDMVSLRLERGGISMTSAARASENGRLGEVIRVKSVDFSSEVRARVTGRSEVSIQ